MSESSKAPCEALFRLATLARERPGQSLTPDQTLQALALGLKATLGSLKELPVRIPGKYQTKVFVGMSGKGKGVFKMLNALDFTASRAEAMRTYSGVRLEVNGKITYVTYASVSGVVVVSSNVSSIDI